MLPARHGGTVDVEDSVDASVGGVEAFEDVWHVLFGRPVRDVKYTGRQQFWCPFFTESPRVQHKKTSFSPCGGRWPNGCFMETKPCEVARMETSDVELRALFEELERPQPIKMSRCCR